jgi:hypothetical protein
VTGPSRQALSNLRHSLAYMTGLIDAILMGKPSDGTLAMTLIPEGLYRLSRRTVAAIEALQQEP